MLRLREVKLIAHYSTYFIAFLSTAGVNIQADVGFLSHKTDVLGNKIRGAPCDLNCVTK
jgi:hypothetical protein